MGNVRRNYSIEIACSTGMDRPLVPQMQTVQNIRSETVALGAAFSSKYKQEVLKDEKANAVTVAFFGDGTCNFYYGQFFESLNMAALWKLPIIFVVKNNLWAIGMSHIRATSVPDIWEKSSAFSR